MTRHVGRVPNTRVLLVPFGSRIQSHQKGQVDEKDDISPGTPCEWEKVVDNP